MATGKADPRTRPDASAKRLLEAIGATDLDYFSAADEGAITEALRSWPLLAEISRLLQVEGAAHQAKARRAAAPHGDADPPLRVVDTAQAAATDGEPPASPAAAHILTLPESPKES